MGLPSVTMSGRGGVGVGGGGVCSPADAESEPAPGALTVIVQVRHPLDLAGALKAPVLGLYGEKDSGIPLDTVDKMKEALRKGSAAAQASEFVVYPDAPHAFHADYRPSFRKEAAEDGWKRALAWLRQHGVA